MESVLGIVILLVIGFVCYVIMHSLHNGANALTDKIIEKVAEKKDPNRYDQSEPEKLADKFKDSNGQ